MNQIIESLNSIKKHISDDLTEQLHNGKNDIAKGLRMAIKIIEEEIENQKDCALIDSFPNSLIEQISPLPKIKWSEVNKQQFYKADDKEFTD